MINIFTKVQAPLCKMKSCLFLRLFVLETLTRPRPCLLKVEEKSFFVQIRPQWLRRSPRIAIVCVANEEPL